MPHDRMETITAFHLSIIIIVIVGAPQYRSHVLAAGLKSCPPVLRACCCQVFYTLYLEGSTNPGPLSLRAIRDYLRAHYFKDEGIMSDNNQCVISVMWQFAHNSFQGTSPESAKAGVTLQTVQSIHDVVTGKTPESVGIDILNPRRNLPPWNFGKEQVKAKSDALEELSHLTSCVKCIVHLTKACPGTYTVTTREYLSNPSKDLKERDHALAVFDHVRLPSHISSIPVLCMTEVANPDVEDIDARIKALGEQHTADRKETQQLYKKVNGKATKGSKAVRSALKKTAYSVADLPDQDGGLTAEQLETELKAKDDEFLREHSLLLEEKSIAEQEKCMKVHVKPAGLRKALKDEQQTVRRDLLF